MAKKWKIFLLICLPIFCALIGVTVYFVWKNINKPQEEIEEVTVIPQLFSDAQISEINTGKPKLLYITMDSQDGFTEEEFTEFYGYPTIKCNEALKSLNEIIELAEKVDNKKVDYIFLHIYPELLKDDFYTEVKCVENIQELYSKTEINILLDYPDISYFDNLEDFVSYKENTIKIAKKFAADPNTNIFYMGAQEWLICNPGNYIEHNRVKNDLTKAIFLYPRTVYELIDDLDSLQAMLKDYLKKGNTSPDLSDRYFVFFGDSVFGYNYGSSSVPGVITGISGAEFADCSKGGTTGARLSDRIGNFTRMVDVFLEVEFRIQNPDSIVSPNTVTKKMMEAYDTYFQGIIDFRNDRLAGICDGKKMIIVINFGLNDYFLGAKIGNRNSDDTTYMGSLFYNVQRLKRTFPDAEIVLLVPGYIDSYDQGNEICGEDNQVLQDYRDAVIDVAKALDVRYIKLVELNGINEENWDKYLSDQIHPNHDGSFYIGNNLIKELAKIK